MRKIPQGRSASTLGKKIRILNWLGLLLGKIPNAFFSILGLILVVGGLAASAFIPSRQVAITTVFATTFFGAALLSLYLPKWILSIYAVREQTEKRVADLEAQVARLKHIQADLGGVREIFNVNVLEIEQRLTNVQETPLDSSNRDEGPAIFGLPPLYAARKRRYLGALSTDCKVLLGAELSEARVVEETKRLVIGGLRMKTVVSAQFPTWLWKQVQNEYSKGGVNTSFDGVFNEPELEKVADQHAKDFYQDVLTGRKFANFEPAVLRALQDRICSLLACFQKQIVFQQEVPVSSIPLSEFIVRKAESITRELEQLEQEKHRLPSGLNPALE
jgi:hypothetical protein